MSAQLRVMAIDAGLVHEEAAAAYAAVSEHQPDIVALMGAPRYQRWRSKRAKLARELGLVVVTADRVGGMFVASTLKRPPTFAITSVAVMA